MSTNWSTDVLNFFVAQFSPNSPFFSVKPVLKKVNKTESKLARFQKKDTGSLASFRNQLKATSSQKFALEEKEDVSKKFSIAGGFF